MKANKAEITALREVMLTPLENFLTDKDDNGKRTQDQLQELAYTRMFTKAIEAVDQARGGRTMYMVVLRHGLAGSTFYTGFGPYATENQAQKELDEVLVGLQPTGWAIVSTRNQEGLKEIWAKADEPPPVKGDWAEVEKDVAAKKNGWKGKHRDRQQYLPEALQ